MRKRYENYISVLLLMFFLLIPGYTMGYTIGYTTGKVVDYFTKKPIKGALITLNDNVVLTDGNGMFTVRTTADKVAVRACGYMRTEQNITMPIITAPLISSPLLIELVPFTPKALYLSVYGIGDRTLRGSALKLIEETELNALVIDVKGDRGIINYRSSVPLASEVGSQKIIIVKDIKNLIMSLKEKGIYTIARIVVFKDNPLALARPDLAVKTQEGEVWHDREGLAWVDPFRKEVWDYDINIAVEAAQSGFDEIQFDYVRFPDMDGLKFSMPNTEENRVNAISDFLAEARRRLTPYNVFLAADIFGYVFWNLNDTDIGQRLEDVAPLLDYISPMLYPSGFHYGIPGYRNPVANPYEIVYLTLKNAQERTHLPSIRFRPWLQAFRDYAFDRRHFTGKEIREQIDAAEKFGSLGWMLWNPHNIYSRDGLKNFDNNKQFSSVYNQH
jgi:hypothetical protein